MRHLLLLLAAVLLAGCGSLTRSHQTIVLDDQLVEHVGQWEHRDGQWIPAGEQPGNGWYLRADRQYHIDRLSFDVRRIDSPDGFVYASTPHWRIELRRDELVAYYQGKWDEGKPQYRYWPVYFWSAIRPLSFSDDQWHRFALEFDGAKLAVEWDDERILEWTSPKDEWDQRVKQSGRVRFSDGYEFPDRFPEPDAVAGRDQAIFLHTFNGRAGFRNVTVVGADAGPVQNLLPVRGSTPFARPDHQFDRLAPLTPVRVDWSLPSAEHRKAADLPAVTQWTIASDHHVVSEKVFGQDNGKPLRHVDYFVGADEPGLLPTSLYDHDRSHGYTNMQRLPQQASIYFNIAEAGYYTLTNEWGLANGPGWGPNILEVAIDGKVVSREVYRAMLRQRINAPGMDYIPLWLNPGPHRADFRLSTDLIGQPHFLTRYLTVPLNPSLKQGLHEPIVRVSRDEPAEGFGQHADALADGFHIGERTGKVVHLEIADLPADASYTVELAFYEIDIDEPGKRLMDVLVNGQRVEQDLDVFAQAGWCSLLTRRYQTTGTTFDDGKTGIAVRLVGKNFKAFLNGVRVLDQRGQEVFRENCGWHPGVSRRLNNEHYVPRQGRNEPLPAAVEHEPGDLWDGHNLVANPHFDVKDPQRDAPAYWWTGAQFAEMIHAPYPPHVLERMPTELQAQLGSHHPNFMRFYDLIPGEGRITHDPEVGREQPGSLRIDVTADRFGVVCNQPPIDYGKLQSLSAYVKTSGATGRIYPEIIWLAADGSTDMKYRDYRGPRFVPRMQVIGRDAGQAITKADDWQQISVTARPPFGAFFALLVIRVDQNTAGSVWIDDVQFNGYGAEPLEVTHSALGYHPKSDKQIVVRSFDRKPVSWRLLSLPDESVAAQGEAAYHSHEWFSQRHYYRFDLTAFSKPGRYRIEVVQGDRRAQSRPIDISRDTYRRLSQIMLNGLYMKRWNTHVVNGHGPDGLDDGHMMVTRHHIRYAVYEKRFLNERRNMVGGWYDAGDDIRHTEFWPGTIFALWNLHRSLESPIAQRTADDVWDELMWGYKVLPRYRYFNGAMYVGSKPGVRALDSVPFYGMDRYLEGTRPVPQVAGIAAQAAWVLRDREPELAGQHLDLALANYNFNHLADVEDRAAEPYEQLLLAGKALLAEIYLVRLQDDPVWAQRLDRHAAMLARCIADGVYAQPSESYQSNTLEGGITQDFIAAATLFVDEHPDHRVTPAMKQALRRFADHVAQVSDPNIWGQAHRLPRQADEPITRWSNAERPIGYWPALAYNLSRIGVILNDPAIIRLAERQLQFCLGKNMQDVSVVHGVGERMVAGGDKLFQRTDFFRHWLRRNDRIYTYDGLVPTMAFREISGAPIRIRKGDEYFPPVYGGPVGFPMQFLQADYPTHATPSEVYLPHQADLTLAAAGVYAALQTLEQP